MIKKVMITWLIVFLILLFNFLPAEAKTAAEYYNLGNDYYDKGDLDKAIEYYQKAIEEDPTCADAYYNMGNVYYDKKDLDKSTDCYLKAIRVKPDHVKAHYNLGLNYQENEEYDQSIKQLEQVLRIDPSYKEAYYDIGVNYYNMDDKAKALENFRTYLKYNTSNDKWAEKAKKYVKELGGEIIQYVQQGNTSDYIMWANSLEDAKKESEKSGKYIFALFSADW